MRRGGSCFPYRICFYGKVLLVVQGSRDSLQALSLFGFHANGALVDLWLPSAECERALSDDLERVEASQGRSQ